MHRTRIPSPARSQSAITPRRKARSTRSLSSPARSITSGRLTSIIDQFKEANRESFALSPFGKTVLTDNTEIEQPRRQSWWRKVNNSRNINEVFEIEKAMEPDNIIDDMEMEVLSQEKKNYTFDLPESSGSESIGSIVIPQRKLFTEKENVPHNKFGQIVASRKPTIKQDETNIEQKTVNLGTKTLFGLGAKRSRPAFSPALLNLSPDKTLGNKTKELTTEINAQPRNLFGNRPATKRKNIFADFIVSESDNEISEIQPKLFAFQRNSNPVRHSTASRGNRESSPASSHTTDIDLDDWKMLPSSTMMEHQFDALCASTPGKKARLSKLSEAKESDSGTNCNNTTNKTKLSNKSASNDKSKITLDITAKEPELEKSIASKSNKLKVNNNKDELETTSKEQNTTLNKSKSNKTKKTLQKIITENKDTIDGNKTANKIIDQTHVLHKTCNSNLPVIDEKSRELTEIQSEANSRVITNQTYKITNDTAKADIAQELQDNENYDDENITLTYDDDEQPEDKESDVTLKTDKTVEEKVGELFKEREDNLTDHTAINQSNIKNKTVVDEIQSKIPIEYLEQIGEKNDVQNMKGKNLSKKQEISVVQNEDQEIKTDQRAMEEQPIRSDDHTIDKQEDAVVDREKGAKQKEMVNEEEMEVDHQVKASEAFEEAAESDNVAELHDKSQNKEKNHDEKIEVEESDRAQDIQEAETSQEEIQTEMETEQNEHEIENEEDKIENDVDNNEDQQNPSLVQEDDNDRRFSEIEVESEEEQNESQIGVGNIEKLVQNKSQIEVENDEEEELNKSEVEVENDEEEGQNKSEIEVGNNEVEEQDESEVEVDLGDEEEDSDTEEKQNVSEIGVENEEDTENHNDEEENEDVEQENESEDVIEESVENDDDVVLETDTEETDAGQGASKAYNVTHDTTGRNRNQDVKSPEAILDNMSSQADSFITKDRNSIIRKSVLKSFTIRQSVAPLGESTGLDDATKNSSAEGSGWDSHRTTRKTLRQTFGKDFTPRKSLRTLVLEKSAKRQTAINDANAKLYKANSTEIPGPNSPDIDVEFNNVEMLLESDHEISKRTRQTTLEMYLQKVKKDIMERKQKIEAEIRNSLKTRPAKVDLFNRSPYTAHRKANIKLPPKAPKAKITKANIIPLDELPEEFIDDMKYKPPKRYKPSNASWITNNLYKFLETKLEAKYDYKARMRAEKLVETIYKFAREARKHHVAPPQAIDQLKYEMARLDVVKTHFEFYNFFQNFMPFEVKIRVVPDIVNEIPLPRNGVFSDIIA